MRITGGTLRGRKIAVPAGIIRPSMDRMRESVFACLGDISGLSFLDIFTGSGIIALEAASRGAVNIEAVEQDKLKRKTLLENISIAPCRINCRFIPAELYIKRAKTSFDIIFLDPPFPYQYKWELTASIALSCLAKDNTRILIHRPRQDYPKTEIQCLTKTDSREYGRSVVDFFHKRISIGI
ncbi:MAG: RsmD family RNA methyltransferase [Treponema sp.]|nr:RsmD family RNA methyltransferase [Treponema sp.]